MLMILQLLFLGRYCANRFEDKHTHKHTHPHGEKKKDKDEERDEDKEGERHLCVRQHCLIVSLLLAEVEAAAAPPKEVMVVA